MLLLRSLVKGDANSARNRLVDPAFDVNAFLRFAYRHQLATYVYSTLRGMDLVDALPRAVRTSVKASALRERGRIERLVAVQREVAAALVAAGIDVLFLKGPLLSHRYYGSVEARSIADLDILVADPSDLPRVQGLLVQLGFEPAFHVPLSMRLTLRFAHHFEYRRDDLPLDVHWVLQRHFTFALDHARIWKTAVRVSMEDGQTYLATSDEYETLRVGTSPMVVRLYRKDIEVRTKAGFADLFWGGYGGPVVRVEAQASNTKLRQVGIVSVDDALSGHGHLWQRATTAFCVLREAGKGDPETWPVRAEWRVVQALAFDVFPQSGRVAFVKLERDKLRVERVLLGSLASWAAMEGVFEPGEALSRLLEQYPQLVTRTGVLFADEVVRRHAALARPALARPARQARFV